MMAPLRPIAALPTHEVTNMPPHLGDQDLWRDDAALPAGVDFDAVIERALPAPWACAA